VQDEQVERAFENVALVVAADRFAIDIPVIFRITTIDSKVFYISSRARVNRGVTPIAARAADRHNTATSDAGRLESEMRNRMRVMAFVILPWR
jgi:hypothetical protein